MIQVSRPHSRIEGTVVLPASKSISNRVLLIRALSGSDAPLTHLSEAADTRILQQLLAIESGTFDTGHAGTTFRFLLSYLCLRPGIHVLTGSERMQQRPVGPLVTALRQLGARITYLNKEGYPPLQIEASALDGDSHLSIPATVSSQFISSLLLIAPLLPKGLRLQLRGKIVSRSYIDMTLSIMAYFGVQHRWEAQNIIVPPQTYRMRPFEVESDWSAASYFYAIAALSNEARLFLPGLKQQSLQGDAAIARIMLSFGVETEFLPEGALLRKRSAPVSTSVEIDFLPCPDIAQTVAVVCAGTGIKGKFSGLDTLSIKETDRIAALQNELAKVGAFFKQDEASTGSYILTPPAAISSAEVPVFKTYEDHRMAMAFAPLSVLMPIAIQHPEVVGKSFPAFWEALEALGFRIVRK